MPDTLEPTRSGTTLRTALVLLAVAGLVAALSISTQARNRSEASLLLEQAGPLTLAALLGVWAARRGSAGLLDQIAKLSASRWTPFVLAATALAGLLAIAKFVLMAFPNSGDEYAFILQAETYARGRLWVAAPEPAAFFDQYRYFIKDGIWVSPYQPGWPLLLAPFALAGTPLWIVCPILGAAMILAFFRLAAPMMGRPAAWLATLALATSPFFLLNFASYFSHGVGALASVGFGIFALEYMRTGRWRDALLAGLCVGFLGFVRAFNAIFLVLPFIAAALLTPNRRIGVIWLGLAGAPWLIALLGYYAAVTGHPLVPVQEWYHSGAEPLGAPSASTLVESARRLVRLYFWTSPLFMAAWPIAFVALAVRRRLNLLDWVAPLTLLGFAFYGGDGGNQYGPRYLFEAWPFAVLTVIRAAEPVLFGGEAPRWRPWAASALLVHILFQVGYCGPRFAREHNVIAERLDLYRDVSAAGISNAVVILAGPTGVTRPLWPRDSARNGLDPGKQPVVYVLDLGPLNRQLVQAFPGRRFYVYRDGGLSPASP